MWTNKLLNKNDNEEELALQIVGSIIPRYKGVKKKKGQEKPDYQGVDIGVEITRAMKHTGEVTSFIEEFRNQEYGKLPKKRLQNMGFTEAPSVNDSKGNSYVQRSKNNGVLWYNKPNANSDLILICGGVSGKNTEEDVVSSVMDKTKKLNSHYKKFSENDLLILVGESMNYFSLSHMIIVQVVDGIIAILKAEFDKKKYKYYFDNLLILFNDYLCEISTETWKYRIYDTTQQMLNFYNTIYQQDKNNNTHQVLQQEKTYVISSKQTLFTPIPLKQGKNGNTQGYP